MQNDGKIKKCAFDFQSCNFIRKEEINEKEATKATVKICCATHSDFGENFRTPKISK